MAAADVVEAGQVIEALTGVPPMLPRKPTRKERHEQKERLRRFLALPPELQEGALRYAERIQRAYSVTKLLTKLR
jgi:hypothetical protein